MASIFGYSSPDELKRCHAAELYQDANDRLRLVAKLRGEGAVNNWEVRGRRKDGETVWCLSNCMLRRELGMIEAVVVDVTEQRRLREELIQMQKMEAIGQLASGITHDFNNLLMVISSYSELLLDELGEEDGRRGHAQKIQAASRRAAELTKKLLVFSRKQDQHLRILDLKAIISELMGILSGIVREDIELGIQHPETLWPIHGDPTQVQQVLMNLVTNARDAMPRGGKIVIKTANEALREKEGPIPAGEYVVVAVSDTGEGIPREVMPRIFEPFFTTKDRERGTGLGLATAHAIVKRSGGQIVAQSEPGRGTTMKIFLPRSRTNQMETAEPSSQPAKQPGSESILLVEDNEGVREAARQYLISLGYKVVAAANGSDALQAAAESAAPINVLVTDVVMPEINGCELGHALLKFHPETKILLMSGHCETTVREYGDLKLAQGLLQKPFTLQVLAERIREMLDTTAASARAGA